MPLTLTSTSGYLRWLTLLVALVSAATSVSAATLRAYVQPSTVRPNQTVSYVIAVQDGNVNSIPELRFPLQVVQNSAASTSQRYQITNGQRSVSMQFAWSISASEPGEFIIPPQDVLVDGQVMKTNEVKLVVSGSGNPSGTAGGNEAEDRFSPLLQLEVGKTEFYQGEVIPLSAVLYVPRNVSLRRLGLVDMSKTDFAIARFPQQSEQGSTEIDGIGYYVMTFRSTLSALRTGDLKVGPATMDILLEVPVEGGRRAAPPGFPQMFFGGQTEPRKFTVKSQEVSVKVLPLPQEGKPANFSGAVGDFTMNASVTPTELKVGDPLSAELIVEGTGNFDGLGNPALVNPEGWKLYPTKRYSVDGQIDQSVLPTVDRRIGFNQVLVPEKVHDVLPPFEISFFSPTQRKYVSLRTSPVQLKMEAPPPAANAQGAATGETQAASTPAQAPETPAPEATLSDIVVHPAATPVWISPIGASLLNEPGFWKWQTVPLIGLVMACVIAVSRRRREKTIGGMAGRVRSAWRSVEESGTSDQEFLHRAAQFVQLAESTGVARSKEVQEVWELYQTVNFAGATQTPLTSQQRSKTLSTLRALKDRVLAFASSQSVKVTAVANGLALLGLMLFVVNGEAKAQEAPEKEKAVPVARAATPDDLYREAKLELEKGNFTRAQYLAESLTKRTPPQLSAELFELIGHARYRQDDFGRAVLWYERAQLFLPHSVELRQNLRHLYEKLKFLSYGEDNVLISTSLFLTPNEWLLIAVGGGWVILLSLSARVLLGKAGRHNLKPRVLLGVIIGLGLLVALPAGVLAAIRPEAHARIKDLCVVTVPGVHVFTSATVTSGTVIDLPPGSQVKKLESRGAWTYVEIPNQSQNLRGWVETLTLTPFWPWEMESVP